MRELTEGDRALCAAQASLFEVSAQASNCGSAAFIRRFMLSDVAKRMDEGSYVTETTEVSQLVREIDLEYGGQTYGSQKYAPGELHWMGYIYRYWCIALNQSSRSVYRSIGARELRSLYGPYHSLDTGQAIERIMEAKGLIDTPFSIERGVEVMKLVREQMQNRSYHDGTGVIGGTVD